jgi:hypothetical protein
LNGDELLDGAGSLPAFDVLNGKGVDVVFDDGKSEDAGFKSRTDGRKVAAIFEQHPYALIIGRIIKFLFVMRVSKTDFRKFIDEKIKINNDKLASLFLDDEAHEESGKGAHDCDVFVFEAEPCCGTDCG